MPYQGNNLTGSEGRNHLGLAQELKPRRLASVAFSLIAHERVVVDQIAGNSTKAALITEGFRKGFGCA